MSAVVEEESSSSFYISYVYSWRNENTEAALNLAEVSGSSDMKRKCTVIK